MKKILLKLTILSAIASTTFAASIDSMGLNIGYLDTNSQKNDISGSLQNLNDPDENLKAVEGYINIKKLLPFKLTTYTSFTYAKNDEIDHQYFLIGASKYYDIKSYELYGTILAGYGEIAYSYTPVSSSTNKKDTTATSYIGGLQVGLNYLINKKFFLGLNAKYLLHEYKYRLQPNTAVSEFEHDHSSFFALSLGYNF